MPKVTKQQKLLKDLCVVSAVSMLRNRQAKCYASLNPDAPTKSSSLSDSKSTSDSSLWLDSSSNSNSSTDLLDVYCKKKRFSNKRARTLMQFAKHVESRRYLKDHETHLKVDNYLMKVYDKNKDIAQSIIPPLHCIEANAGKRATENYRSRIGKHAIDVNYEREILPIPVQEKNVE